jgi:hypothetical protein
MIVHCGPSVLDFNGEKWSTLYQTYNVYYIPVQLSDSILKVILHIIVYASHMRYTRMYKNLKYNTEFIAKGEQLDF